MSNIPSVLNEASLIAAALVIVYGAVRDVVTFKIPNIASLLLILLFPLFGLTSGQMPFPWINHAATFAVILGGGYALYTKKWAGAGDVKFAAAIGLWAGLSFWWVFLAATALSGGLLSVGLGAWAYWKGRVARAREAKYAWLRMPVPYGVAIAIGGLCTLLLLSHPELTPRG